MNNIETLIAKISDTNNSDEKNETILDLIDDELKEFIKNLGDINKFRRYFTLLTDKYPQLRSDKLQAKLVSILIQRFGNHKHEIKGDCLNFVQDNKIASFFENSIRISGGVRDKTLLLQNLLSILQWSHDIDLPFKIFRKWAIPLKSMGGDAM